MKKVFRSVSNWFAPFFHSIRFRLTLWFVFILALVLGVFSAFIYFIEASDLQVDSEARMQEKFAYIQNYFRGAEWQDSDLSSANMPGSATPLQKGDLIVLLNTNGMMLQNWGEKLAKSDDITSQLVNAGSQAHELNVYEQTISVINGNNQIVNRDYLFVITPILRGNLVMGYLVIGSPSDLNSQMRRLKTALILGSLAMLVVAFLGGLWLADRAMRPVATITHAARNISESDLSRRLNMRGRDELAKLAETFDDMLARLQAAFDRQRRFVADASHELRTPLTIVNLEVGRALSSRRSAAEYQRTLQVVNAEGERMARLVNDLMTLARMDAGQAILQFEYLDFSDVALEAVERMSALAEDRHVKLETGELPELPIRGDRQYLIQMISNLIENGIKYSGADKVVRVETDGTQDKATLRISDSGPGIPPEHLPHLFDRFYRVDAARSQNSDDPASPTGSGLGLSIVAWVVQAHNGNIKAESRVNEGTTFEITLPLT
ncbi:MAG: HAMP domain-containing protein [Chloroflexi bacterium]|nr:HAMP domain-containing protein [Chloroflexota bacterium]MBI3339623.1 HAMP domain-containing protein [Chloroflexota bacterium]